MPPPVAPSPVITQGYLDDAAMAPAANQRPAAPPQGIVFTDFPQGPAPTQAPPAAVPGLQNFITPAQQTIQPTQIPGLTGATIPQPPPSGIQPVSGLQGFAAPQASGTPAPGSHGGNSNAGLKKSRLDGTLDPSDLDAEIARYERELAEQKALEANRPALQKPADVDPLAAAFLTPEELGRLGGSAPDSFPTRRMPLGPGQQP